MMTTNTPSPNTYREPVLENLEKRETTTLFLGLTGSIATRLYPLLMRTARDSGFTDIILHPTMGALPFFVDTFVERHRHILEILGLEKQTHELQESIQSHDARSHILVRAYFAQIDALLSERSISSHAALEIRQTIESYEDGDDIRGVTQQAKGNIKHIDIARKSRAILIAPATANTIAKIVYGITDNFLLEVVRATASDGSVPVFIAPAMNSEMLRDPYTQKNIASLRDDGQPKYHLFPTQEKLLQCGEYGDGGLLGVREIFERITHYKK